LRDMESGEGPYGLEAWKAQFDRIRTDLEDSIELESRLAPASRPAAQREVLNTAFNRFWSEADRLWALAREGRTNEARTLIRTRLEAERATITTLVSRLLIQNNEAESENVRVVARIYSRVERNLYFFLAAVLIAILVTSLSVLRFNRRVFDRLAQLGDQRKALAAKLIDVQEQLFRTLGRELHDEFGQVLTAMGAMLGRVERKLPESDPGREQIHEVRQIANETLERVRGMSQMLHPPVLDDYGLEKSIEWYTAKYGKQTGLTVRYEKIGTGPWIGDQAAIHAYRILQESLTNVFKHAGVEEVSVKLRYSPGALEMTVEDHGKGLPHPLPKSGIGIIAMRERAELLGGTLEFARPPQGGTRVILRVPLDPGTAEAE